MIYKGKSTKNISFPLGGIGTGCIGLSGNGQLIDWELFNRPNKNTLNGYSHFAIKASLGGKSITRILQGDTNDNLMGPACESRGFYGFGFGPRSNSLAGFPHFKNVTFDGFYPLAKLTFSDEDFPLTVKLCAFNPFIPHDEFNSSLPSAFFEWEIENPSDEEVNVTLAATVCNPSSSPENREIRNEGCSGLMLGCCGTDPDDISYSDLCLLTDHPDTAVQEYWYRGKWQDSPTTYWRNLTELDRMPKRSYGAPYEDPDHKDHGTVASYVTVAPGARAKIRFVISWNVPNAYNYWEENKKAPWKNYYATVFENSYKSGAYALENFVELYEKTKKFADALCSTTLPEQVKDAISANLSVIKTPTVLRLSDGSFWAWEGCIETVGSCHGTCQHVWSYAYVMPYLFPRLERSIRDMTMNYATLDSGATAFRIDLPLKRITEVGRSCLDGQMGEVIKCYREWKFSGDDSWLEAHAESIFKMLEYAWSEENPDRWDRDMDGVLEGRQHHTLDMELFGPSSWLEGFYLLALDCGRKIAEHLGESERASLYGKLYEKGKRWMNENLFNGKYFFQKVDLADKATLDSFGATDDYWNEEAKEIKYQIGEGSVIDQMLADWHGALLGLEGVFDKDKKRTALESLYKNNYKPSMRRVANMWRNFALNDEAGTVICTYPEGARMPAIPIAYCEECMTGFEYALAGLMISEGYIPEGESMVEAIRSRYDGEKRNPWNEMECGSNYARSMASFALMPIYCGFTFDMTKNHLSFKPVYESGRFLFSAGESWGYIEFSLESFRIKILGSPLTLSSVCIPGINKTRSVKADGKEIDFKQSNGCALFEKITVQDEMIFE